MRKLSEGFAYNERLFEGAGLRAYFHRARFRWLRQVAQKYYPTHGPHSVIELGCFDGKAIDYLPRGGPGTFLGLDANWENGLDLARKRWHGKLGYAFLECKNLTQFQVPSDVSFDCAISMETLEHLPPQDLDAYLRGIAQSLDGYFFVTVPNEKGPLFLLKWLAKRILSTDQETYTFKEIFWATVGRMHRVSRDQHKGFDWARLVTDLQRHFDVLEVSGHPMKFLPTWACFSVGIVAHSRNSR